MDLARLGALGLIVLLATAACGGEDTATYSTEADNRTVASAVVNEAPWWEGRTWEGEVEICVGVTADQPGCEWLADLLVNRGCELKVYQTFVAALIVGAHLDTLYEGAVRDGDCPLRDEEIGASSN